MDKLFYIKYNRLEEIRDTQTPIGVVIDTREFGSEEFDRFVNSLEEDSHNIQSTIIKTEFNPEIAESMSTNEDVYYVFSNELEMRKEIQSLPRALQKRIIGNKICRTGVDIILYRMSGITNVQVASPLINSKVDLEMLKALGWTLFTTPNLNDSWGDMVDPNWIRPEGIHLYDDLISGYLLASDGGSNVNVILRAYLSETWLGDLRDFLVNFDNDINPYRNQRNLLMPTFDVMRSTSGDNQYFFESMKREFELSNILTGVEKEDIDK